MPCFHPLSAWRDKPGVLAFKYHPGLGKALQLPCGQCIGCRADRASQWAARIMHEAALHEENCFVTLTYAPEHLPPGGTLVPRDVQDFIRRLRRALPSHKLRYFLCGEYGEKFSRPHYHLCLFGWQFLPDRKVHRKTEFGNLYTSVQLDEIWGLGQCQIGKLTTESAGYVARYSWKKITGKMARGYYSRVDAVTGEIFKMHPEFARMSLKPGIGDGWLQRFKSDVYPCDYVLQKGKKTRVPKFYDSKLPRHELEELKLERRNRAKKHAGNNTPARLAVRKEVFRRRIEQLKRTVT